MGGIYIPHRHAEVSLFASILVKNTPGVQQVNCPGLISSGGYNIIDSISCVYNPYEITTDLIDVEPRLFPLADYGGDTLSHALRPTSPAIDWFPQTDDYYYFQDLRYCDEQLDQRRVSRWLWGGKCDIGAVEYTNGINANETLNILDTGLMGRGIYRYDSLDNATNANYYFYFSRPVFDAIGTSHPNEWDNLNNYMVFHAGANNHFETTACPSLQGDDVAISFTLNPSVHPAYSRNNEIHDYSIALHYGFQEIALVTDEIPADKGVRLIICDTIQTVAGSTLDGNFDNVAGGDFVLDRPRSHYDLNMDNIVSATDAMLVINRIGELGIRFNERYKKVYSEDTLISELDVQQIIDNFTQP